jgi:uncharacterized membrane protein YhaH (DUF805 family)
MDKIPQFLARYLWISGRSTRREWWLVHFLAAIALVKNEMSLLDHTAPGPNGEPVLAVPFTWLATNFVLLWISFASIVRRLHDRDKSGWWAVLYLLPFVGWVWLVIECGFLPGRPSRWTAEDRAPIVPEVEDEPAPPPMPMPAHTIGAAPGVSPPERQAADEDRPQRCWPRPRRRRRLHGHARHARWPRRHVRNAGQVKDDRVARSTFRVHLALFRHPRAWHEDPRV